MFFGRYGRASVVYLHTMTQALELGPGLIVVHVVQAVGVGDETTLFLFACIHMRIHLQEFVRILPLFCGGLCVEQWYSTQSAGV